MLDTVTALQMELVKLPGNEALALDGHWGPITQAAFFAALQMPAARPISAGEVAQEAASANLEPRLVHAVLTVESSGRGFDPKTLMPLILFEPHKFHGFTGGLFDGHYPAISYPRQGMRPYPPGQGQRWAQMAQAAALDPGAALKSASWGLFQIMGFNAEAAGFLLGNGQGNTWGFVRAMASSEAAQLRAFLTFVINTGLDKHLKARDWLKFATGYNGQKYAADYAGRIARAYGAQR